MRSVLPKFAISWAYKKTKTNPQRGTIIAEAMDCVFLTRVGKGTGVDPYTVVYGLQSHNHGTFESAMAEFSGCIDHAITCNGEKV